MPSLAARLRLLVFCALLAVATNSQAAVKHWTQNSGEWKPFLEQPHGWSEGTWQNGDTAHFSLYDAFQTQVTLLTDIYAEAIICTAIPIIDGGANLTLTTNRLDVQSEMVHISGLILLNLTGTHAFTSNILQFNSQGHLIANASDAISGGLVNMNGDNSTLIISATSGISGGQQDMKGGNVTVTITSSNAITGGTQNFIGGSSHLNADHAGSIIGGQQNFLGENTRLVASASGAVMNGQLNFSGSESRLVADASYGVIGGNRHFSGQSHLISNFAHGVVGGTTTLSGSARATVNHTNGIDRNSSFIFDNSSAGPGGTLELHGVSTTIGAISSTNGAGVITNTGTSHDTIRVDFDSGTSSFSGSIQDGTGRLALEKAGSGEFILTGLNNHYTGGTWLKAGTLSIASNLNLPSTTAIDFDGGTLKSLAAISFHQAFVINAGGGAFNSNGFTSTVETLGGSGTFTKTGAGKLLLVGANNVFQGSMHFDQGTFEIFSGKTLQIASSGTSNLSGAGTFLNSGTLILSGNVDSHAFLDGTGIVIKNGGGQANLRGNSTYSGSTILESGKLGIGNDQALGSGDLTIKGGGLVALDVTRTLANHLNLDGNFTLGRDLNIASNVSLLRDVAIISDNATAGSGASTFSGNISGAHHVEISQGDHADTIIFSGSNSYTGGTILSGATLQLGSANALSSTGAITMLGGTLKFTSGNTHDYSNRFSSTSDQQFRFDTNGQDVTLATTLTSAGGSLIKTGLGNLTLSASNNYTGGSILASGTVRLQNSHALADSGAIAMTGATLQYSSANTTDYSGRFSSGSNAAYRIDTNGQSVTFASALSSNGGILTKLGAGQLHLSASNSYNGGTVLESGTLSIGNDHALGSGLLTINGGVLRAAGSEHTLGNNIAVNNSFTLGRLTHLSGSMQLNTDTTITLDNPDAAGHYPSTISGNISGVNSLTFTNGTHPNGNLILSGSNSYTGGTIVNGGTLTVSNNRNLGAASGHVTLNNATLHNTGDVNSTRNLTLNGLVNVIDTEGGFATYGVLSGAAALVKNGNHILTISGSSDYTGHTYINAGTLKVDQGMLRSSGVTLSGSSTLLFDSETRYENSVTGTGTLAREFSGTTIFTGTSASTVDVDIRNGTFEVRLLGKVMGHVHNNGRFTVAGSGAFDGTISGTGSLFLNTGHWNFSHDNTFSGGTDLHLATAIVSSTHALGTGTIHVGNFSTVHTTQGVNITNKVYLQNTGAYHVVTNSGTIGHVAAATSDVGGRATSAIILSGSSATGMQLQTSFTSDSEAVNDQIRLSDVYHFDIENYDSSNIFAMELSINSVFPTAYIGWLNDDKVWVNAIQGNVMNNATLIQQGFLGSFELFQNGNGGSFAGYGTNLSQYIGAWGITTDGGVTKTWAVLTHNSEFGVIPEPSTYALFALGAIALFAHLRRIKRSA